MPTVYHSLTFANLVQGLVNRFDLRRFPNIPSKNLLIFSKQGCFMSTFQFVDICDPSFLPSIDF